MLSVYQKQEQISFFEKLPWEMSWPRQLQRLGHFGLNAEKVFGPLLAENHTLEALGQAIHLEGVIAAAWPREPGAVPPATWSSIVGVPAPQFEVDEAKLALDVVLKNLGLMPRGIEPGVVAYTEAGPAVRAAPVIVAEEKIWLAGAPVNPQKPGVLKIVVRPGDSQLELISAVSRILDAFGIDSDNARRCPQSLVRNGNVSFLLRRTQAE